MIKQNLKVFNSTDFPGYLPKLNALYDDLFDGGKYFRSRLVGQIGKHIGVDEKGAHLLGQTIEFIHNASLLHDDLIDRSHLRRGKTTAWLKYSPEYAVLAGDYLLARVMVNLSKEGNIELVQYTSEMISDLLEGEWIQDSLVRDWDIETSQLDKVHDLKTSSLFKWCLRSPFVYKKVKNEEIHSCLNEMGQILGSLFQRSDDLLDFDVRNHEGKALLGDLKSGYLNSFGVYLSNELSAEKKKEMIQSQSMADLYAAIGEGYFQEKISDFDAENEKKIELYFHRLDQLIDILPEEQKSLKKDLEKLPQLLYWRKK